MRFMDGTMYHFRADCEISNFTRSARGVPQAVANLELVTAPDQALFGSRIETSCGPYAAKAGLRSENFEDTNW